MQMSKNQIFRILVSLVHLYVSMMSRLVLDMAYVRLEHSFGTVCTSVFMPYLRCL